MRGSEIGKQLGGSVVKYANIHAQSVADFFGIRLAAAIIEVHVAYYWIAARRVRLQFNYPHDGSIIGPTRSAVAASLVGIGVTPDEISPLIDNRFNKYRIIEQAGASSDYVERLGDLVAALCLFGDSGGKGGRPPTPHDASLCAGLLAAFDATTCEWLRKFRAV